MLLEVLFKNQGVNIKISDYDLSTWTISDNLSHNFGLKITDTMTFLSYHHNRSSKILEYYSFILSLDGISLNNKQTSIYHDKFTHLSQNCVMLKKLFDQFYEKKSWVVFHVKTAQKLMLKALGPTLKIIGQWLIHQCN